MCVMLHTYLYGHSLSEEFHRSKMYFLIFPLFWDLLIGRGFFSPLDVYMVRIQLEKNIYPHLTLHVLKINVLWSQLSLKLFVGAVKNYSEIF